MREMACLLWFWDVTMGTTIDVIVWRVQWWIG